MGLPDQPWGQQGEWGSPGGQSGSGQPNGAAQPDGLTPFDQPTQSAAFPAQGLAQPGAVQQQAGGQQGYQQQGYQPGQPWAGGPAYGPQAGYPGLAGPKNNTLAITALVCGCAQFVLWFLILVPGFLAAVAALVCGAIGLRQIRVRGEGGRGMAIAGVVLGVLGVLGGIVWLVAGIAVSVSNH
jgi:hypothetical protein